MDQEQIEQEHDIAQMHLTIDQARAHIEFDEALQRLKQNPDFQMIVSKNYCQDQLVRLGHLLSAAEMQRKSKRRAIIKEIEAIGLFQSYLNVLHVRANMAREAIRVNEEELAAIAQENAQMSLETAAVN